jgi:SAM-dependent methyltransferase
MTMSSPIALERKAKPKKALINLHRSLSHGHRVQLLADRVAAHIEALVPQGVARCLDIGCGDMTLAETVEKRLPRTDWRCIDVHPLPPALRDDARWSKYTSFDGRTIPYDDRAFDVALFCDVLHHAPDDAPRLLAEAGRVARHVLVKDHFEYGAYSRSMLRLMDFVGNWGYGIGIPKHYFTQTSFRGLVAQQGLAIEALDCGLDLYDHLPVVGKLLRPDWQFIAVLSRG